MRHVLHVCKLAGAGAGVVTAICTTPLDVLKTRLMTQGAKKTYSGPFDCLSRILKEEGASALFKVGLAAVIEQRCGAFYIVNYECNSPGFWELFFTRW